MAIDGGGGGIMIEADLPIVLEIHVDLGMVMKRAIDAEKDIKKYGRHDEGESSRAGSRRRGDVRSRSTSRRERFLQRTLAAIRAQVETIVPRLPGRSTDARPVDPVALREAMQRLRLGNRDIVPRVETSIAPVVPSSDGPAVDPLPLSPSYTGPLVMDDSFLVSADGIVISPRDIVHLVRDDDHDDSTIHAFETPAFSIVGETIEVFGAYGRPVSDLVAPVPVPVPTPPRTRRGPRGSCSRSARDDESLVIHLPSSVIPMRIRLTGRAAAVYRHFDPSDLDLPPMIPVGVEVSIWGRRWIVRSSTLGPRAGLGLFACEDIIVDAADMDSSAHLFPYAGTVYLRNDMRVLHACSPGGFTPYLLDVDSTRPSIPPTERRFIDGDPARCSNIAGYINSSLGRRQGVSDGQISENVEFHYCGDAPRHHGRRDLEFHIVVVAIRSIRAGDELFASYSWGSSRIHM
ncbi:hypothetical protein R1sor_000743 [Riccia sorocarpa]|uniref:SET domain-containing protein n=1 Tax=Riccia sorocarpa TaxID=122646 RepID=A0ABD3GY58_9MARC